jgi:hypothetical protein
LRGTGREGDIFKSQLRLHRIEALRPEAGLKSFIISVLMLKIIPTCHIRNFKNKQSSLGHSHILKVKPAGPPQGYKTET